MADKSTALYTRVMPTLREALNAFAERHGMDAAMVVRILIAQAIERDLRRDDDTVRVCVECGQVVRPDAEGRPQWHRHRGILYGEQEQL